MPTDMRKPIRDLRRALERLGMQPLLGALDGNPYWARNWLLFGQDVSPIPGAVLVFARGSDGHVGLAIGEDDSHFHVLSIGSTVWSVADKRVR